MWEYLAVDGWHVLDPAAGEVDDETRALTLGGLVSIRVPGDMVPTAIGVVVTPRFHLRCRLVRGAHDSAPQLLALTMNALVVEQATPALEQFIIAPSAVPVGAISVGQRAVYWYPQIDRRHSRWRFADTNSRAIYRTTVRGRA